MRARVIFLAALIVLAILGLMSPAANAETRLDTVGMHIGSQHFPAKEWNNTNPGFYVAGSINGVSWLPSGRYVAGGYYNSERKGSMYVGYIYPVTNNLDVVLGAVSGYKKYPVLPMVVPSIHFGLVDGWRARIHYLPKIEKSGSHVVHLSIERKF